MGWFGSGYELVESPGECGIELLDLIRHGVSSNIVLARVLENELWAIKYKLCDLCNQTNWKYKKAQRNVTHLYSKTTIKLLLVLSVIFINNNYLCCINWFI